MKKKHPPLKHARRKRQHPAKRKINRVFAGIAAFFVLAGLAVFAHKEKLDMTDVFFRHEAASLDVEIETGARGNIYDRNLKLLAGTYQTSAIYARPLEVIDLQVAAKKIAPALGVSDEDLLNTLKSERAFVWLGRKITAKNAEKIKALNLDGIYLVEEMNRTYPHKSIASHVLGYVSKNKGLDGVEFYYDSILSGGVPDVRSLPVRLDTDDAKSLRDKGGHIRLTLDLAMQTRLEKQLARLIKKSGAKSGVAMAMDPDSGAILAMASHPYFDPNQFWDFKEEARVNRVITGAVFPPIPAPPVVKKEVRASDKKPKKQSRYRLLTPNKIKKTIARQPVQRAQRAQRIGAVRIDESPFFLAGRYISLAKEISMDLPASSIFSELTTAGTGSTSAMNLSPRAATPLAILTAFTSLAGQGRAITPHLLSGILIPATEKTISSPATESTKNLFTPETGSRIWQDMLANAIPGPSDSLLFEYIDTRDDEKSVEDDENIAENTDHYYHRLLLGVAPQSKPEITFLMAVNFGRNKSRTARGKDAATSALLSMGKREIGRVLKMARATPKNPGPAFWNQETQLADAPANSPKAVKSKKTASAGRPEKAIMPAIAGKSLRHGLQAIQHIEARVKIIGSGLIVDQQPRAGARITKGDLCILKLENTL